MGPPIRKESFYCGDWMKSLMQGEMKAIDSNHCPVVDVRDVGFAHLQAIKVALAANRRFIVSHVSPTFQELAQVVINKYAPLGWPVCQIKAESEPKEDFSLFDNLASREVLGVVYTDFKKTMIDMADRMVELGTVTKFSTSQ